MSTQLPTNSELYHQICETLYLCDNLRNSKTVQPNFTEFFVHVDRGHGSVVL